MGFVSEKYNREYEQLSKPLEEVREDASWEDGFQASIGFNADENRSYSAFINHNGYEERIRKINELGIDLKPYIEKNLRENGIYRANYNEVAKDYPEIKTDEQIRQERNEMLAKRRAYAKEIMSRSPSSAVIAGDAIAMITDPIMWPTLAYSIPVRGAQGLGALAKAAAKGAGKAAAYEGAAEAAVQAMVYSHKIDIGSEYTADDAINSIALATGIGAGIGALVPLGAKGLEKIIGDENLSIQDYLQKQLDSVDIEKLDDEGLEAYRDVSRLNEMLDGVPAEKQKEALKEIEAFRENYEKNTAYRPEYKQEVVENAPQANIASLEKEVLSRVGIDDSMNIIQSEYDKLDIRVLLDNEDNMVNADEVIEKLKTESNSIENVMRCVRG